MMAEYIPSPIDWVREQVELYESSGGREGTALRETGLPCVLITHKGNKSGGIRKVPLMRVKVDAGYVLIGSNGGSAQHPVWVHNFRANPGVELRDGTAVFKMRLREVENDPERAELWAAGVEAFPTYEEYKAKTPRKIALFLAEPV